MEHTTGEPGVWTLAAGTLAPGQTMKFRLNRRGKLIEGFIVNVSGSYHAYVNRCPHAGTPLDTWPNEFLTEDGRHLICSTHGAIFDQRTGLCVEGPCPGACLEILPTESERGVTIVRCPG